MITLNNHHSPGSNFCSEFIIRVAGGESAPLRGKIEHIHSGQVHYFNDFLELVLLIQNKLDQCSAPQSDAQMRSFFD